MVTVNEITTYSEGKMFWADATEVVDISAPAAWESLEPLLMRLIEIPTVGGEAVEVRRAKKGVPVTYAGNRLVAKALMLGGIIKASMSMEVTISEPPRYLRLAVNVFSNHFADVEFRIEPVESGCRLSYRQGFRSKNYLLGWKGKHVTTKPGEMPETARIFNMWIEIMHSV